MHAIVVSSTGGPEQLEWVERPTLEPGPGQILVRTHAAGLNFIDTYQRSGVYERQLPYVPGSEGSGVVEAVGDGVEALAVGDRVATVDGRGTYSELFVVDADLAVRVPDGIDMDVASALPLQGLTAHALATSAATPGEGDTAVVHAGAGGVGLLLTQLLTARGVQVFTTTSTEEKAQLSRAAGAADVFGYDDFRERVREATGGDGADVVYDGVGKRTFDDSLATLRIRGRLVLFGGASGQVPPFDLQRLNAAGSVSVTRPAVWHFLLTPEERAWRWGELFDAVQQGSLDVRIGERFPLHRAPDAHAALEGRRTTGKVILTAE